MNQWIGSLGVPLMVLIVEVGSIGINISMAIGFLLRLLGFNGETHAWVFWHKFR